MPRVQIGIIARRTPSGNFLKAKPIYAEIAESELSPAGMTKTEEQAIDDFASFMAAKFKAYQDAVRAIGKKK